MPVHAVCKIINESDNKIWRLLDKYVKSAREHEDFSEINAIGVDETSRAKGHEYVSLFVDLKERWIVFVSDGKYYSTINQFAEDLIKHNGDPLNIKDASCDMSPAFIKGVRETLPEADITFDKFHIFKIINKAVGRVRKQEAVFQPLLNKTKYIFLKNEKIYPSYNSRSLRQLAFPT